MKLRGFKISKPDFSSDATMCCPSKRDSRSILLPLKSIKGVGEKAAITVSNAYKELGDELFKMTIEELEKIKIDGKKAFGKKFLEGYFEIEN